LLQEEQVQLEVTTLPYTVTVRRCGAHSSESLRYWYFIITFIPYINEQITFASAHGEAYIESLTHRLYLINKK
jgi:hypothetical protein